MGFKDIAFYSVVGFFGLSTLGSITTMINPDGVKGASTSQSAVDVISKPKATERGNRWSPEDEISVADLRWTKVGFGSVMEISATIRNKNSFAVKDIEITCEHAAASGTMIDSNTRVVYQQIPANASTRVRDFNMGFIAEQAERTACKVTSAEAL